MTYFKHQTIFLILCCIAFTHGQTDRQPMTYALGFLLINPDARSAGFGNQGVATSADVFSQYWNPAKYLFAEETSAIGLSYTPYLRTSDTQSSLSNLTYFNKKNTRSVWSGSLNYFSYGEIVLKAISGNIIVNQGVIKPREWAADISYSLLLSKQFAMGVTARYIHSNLSSITNSSESINALSFNVSIFQQSNLFSLANRDAQWRMGLTLSNLGPRLKSLEGQPRDFLPTTLRFGSGIIFLLSNESRLSFNLEGVKFLVPEMELIDEGTVNARYHQPDKNFISGVFNSFTDHSDGFSGELKEIGWSFGSEFTLSESIRFRLGYFYENESSGGRQFLSFGAGVKKSIFALDLSYLTSTSDLQNPLQNTLRFSASILLNEN